MDALKFVPRDPQEENRASTPLELLFDLASVIAVSAAANGLHHGISEGHIAQSIVQFVAAFFMVWWSWMNYTWFASAYDDQSWGFRLLSMAAIFGALTLAAGIPTAYKAQPLILALAGFVMMRVAMAILWIGAAMGDARLRKTALAYGLCIITMQLFWVWMVLTLSPSDPRYLWLFLAGAIAEVSVPAICEGIWGRTTWNPGHITERYGLLNLIVLGECFLSVTAILAAFDGTASANSYQLEFALTAAVITFCLWGAYFTGQDYRVGAQLTQSLLWGYSHFVLFAAGAAVGAGFAAHHEALVGPAAVGDVPSGLSVAVPVSLYLLSLWTMRDLKGAPPWSRAILPAVSALTLISALIIRDPLPAMAMLLTAGVWLRNFAGKDSRLAERLAGRTV